MSHTWKHGETSFTGNADFSGDVTIVNGPGDFDRITISFADLLAFVKSEITPFTPDDLDLHDRDVIDRHMTFWGDK